MEVRQMYGTVGNSPKNYLTVLNFGWGSTNNNGNLYTESILSGNSVPYNSLKSFTENFTYDHVNRLSSANDSRGWPRNFAYDPYGNMWVTANSGIPLAGHTHTSHVSN